MFALLIYPKDQPEDESYLVGPFKNRNDALECFLKDREHFGEIRRYRVLFLNHA
jgi:hypothetical protein